MNKKIILYNKTKNLNLEIKCADTFFKKFKGLMFKKNMKIALLIKLNSKNKYTSSIHSCFMRKTIELYFIDENNKIFEIAILKPWRFYIPKKEAKYVLEIKKNFISDLELNDEILLKRV
ncbi:MAG: DUF192 domain-containing protein [Methanobacteriaceae archaeon]|nr:DUF192 domain-containing protein [Methanobacteriaceae archaeon]